MNGEELGWRRECADADALLRHLSLNPEQCRTDGGWLNVARIKTLLAERSPRVALSDEQLTDIWNESLMEPRSVYHFARAVIAEYERINGVARIVCTNYGYIDGDEVLGDGIAGEYINEIPPLEPDIKDNNGYLNYFSYENVKSILKEYSKIITTICKLKYDTKRNL